MAAAAAAAAAPSSLLPYFRATQPDCCRSCSHLLLDKIAFCHPISQLIVQVRGAVSSAFLRLCQAVPVSRLDEITSPQQDEGTLRDVVIWWVLVYICSPRRFLSLISPLYWYCAEMRGWWWLRWRKWKSKHWFPGLSDIVGSTLCGRCVCKEVIWNAWYNDAGSF